MPESFYRSGHLGLQLRRGAGVIQRKATGTFESTGICASLARSVRKVYSVARQNREKCVHPLFRRAPFIPAQS